MATFTFKLRGDQIGSFTSLKSLGDDKGHMVLLTESQALGNPDEIFQVIVEKADDAATQFDKGQLVTIIDAQGNAVIKQFPVEPYLEYGLAAGDEHLVLPGAGLFIDLGGISAKPIDVTYDITDEIALKSLGDNDGELDFKDMAPDFPCFATGTRIATPFGLRDVEALKAGDLVMTLDDGPRAILWIGRKSVDLTSSGGCKRPFRVPAGASGPGVPARDLTLSPQHRLLVDGAGRPAAGSGGTHLAAVKALAGYGGIAQDDDLQTVTYHSVLLRRHSVILADGLPCETFYPGRYMMAALPPACRTEILRLVPDLIRDPETGYGATARPVLRTGLLRQAARWMIAA
jgi:Hint domain